MATATRAAAGRRGTAGGRVVAILAWCVAVWTTKEFIEPLGVQAGTPALLTSIIIQLIMTWGESPIWAGRASWWNVAILVLDTATNIGGLFFFVMKFDQTDSWAAFNTGLGTTGGINPFAALVVSGVLGVLLAATPEYLWRQQ